MSNHPDTLYLLVDAHQEPTVVMRGDVIDVRNAAGTAVFRMNLSSLDPVLSQSSPSIFQWLALTGFGVTVAHSFLESILSNLTSSIWAQVLVPSVCFRSDGMTSGVKDAPPFVDMNARFGASVMKFGPQPVNRDAAEIATMTFALPG